MSLFSPRSSARDDDDEYTAVPTIPLEDDPLHTQDHPFCYDDACGCHEDHLLVDEINTAYQDGLLTSKEATDVTRGRTV